MGHVVGIDLGTTNSLVAYVKRRRAERDPRCSRGDALVPSVVSIAKRGRFSSDGGAASAADAPSPHGYPVKRFMGRGIEDVRDDAELLPFHVGRAGWRGAHWLGGREFTPPEISAFVLKELSTARRSTSASRASSTSRSIARSSPCPPTSTTPSDGDARCRPASPASTCFASSTSPPRPRSPTGSTSVTAARLRCTTWAADVRYLDPRRSRTACSRCCATNGDTHLGGDDIDRLAGASLVLAGPSAGRRNAVPRPAPETLQAIRKAVIQAKWRSVRARRDRDPIDPSPVAPAGFSHAAITRAEFER